MLDAKAREALRGFQHWTGAGLSRIGFTANALTALGIAMTGVAAWLVLRGDFLAGGLVLIGGAFLDFCDGAVAKHRGTASTFGAFIDSVSDRVSDGAIFAALTWRAWSVGDQRIAAAALSALVLAQLTSYIRAKAESLGYDCKVGILERAERFILLCAGLLLSVLEVMLWAIVALAAVTVVQRLVHVHKQARDER